MPLTLRERCDLICPDLPNGAVFTLRNSLPLYRSTCVHPARSRSSRARCCSTLASCKGWWPSRWIARTRLRDHSLKL